MAENNSASVIFSDPRLVRGHLLVIPNRHAEKLSELSPEERRDLLELAIDFQRRIMENLASGCDLEQHCRPFLPEGRLKVNHVHIHLLPRELDDEIYFRVRSRSELFTDLPETEAAELRSLLSPACPPKL